MSGVSINYFISSTFHQYEPERSDNNIIKSTSHHNEYLSIASASTNIKDGKMRDDKMRMIKMSPTHGYREYC